MNNEDSRLISKLMQEKTRLEYLVNSLRQEVLSRNLRAINGDKAIEANAKLSDVIDRLRQRVEELEARVQAKQHAIDAAQNVICGLEVSHRERGERMKEMRKIWWDEWPDFDKWFDPETGEPL